MSRSPDCSAAMMHAAELSSSSAGPGARANGDGVERHSARAGSSGRWQLARRRSGHGRFAAAIAAAQPLLLHLVGCRRRKLNFSSTIILASLAVAPRRRALPFPKLNEGVLAEEDEEWMPRWCPRSRARRTCCRRLVAGEYTAARLPDGPRHVRYGLRRDVHCRP
jgi:hypothetical protein